MWLLSDVWNSLRGVSAHHVEMKGDKFGQPRGIRRLQLAECHWLMRAGSLRDKSPKTEEEGGGGRLIRIKPQFVESHNAWREQHQDTRRRVIIRMQIPHELPPIRTLLPPPHPNTTTRGLLSQQSIRAGVTTNSGKRRELSVDRARLLHLMTSSHSHTCTAAEMNCSSSSQRMRGKAVAAGWVFFQVRAIDQWASREREKGVGGWVAVGGKHGSEEAAGVGKRKHNHISSQTNAPPLMEMDRGVGIPVHAGDLHHFQPPGPSLLSLPSAAAAAAAAAAAGPNIWTEVERETERERKEITRRVEG